MGLDLEAGKNLVKEFTAMGIVPEDVEMSAGTYPREDLLEVEGAGE